MLICNHCGTKDEVMRYWGGFNARNPYHRDVGDKWLRPELEFTGDFCGVCWRKNLDTIKDLLAPKQIDCTVTPAEVSTA